MALDFDKIRRNALQMDEKQRPENRKGTGTAAADAERQETESRYIPLDFGRIRENAKQKDAAAYEAQSLQRPKSRPNRRKTPDYDAMLSSPQLSQPARMRYRDAAERTAGGTDGFSSRQISAVMEKLEKERRDLDRRASPNYKITSRPENYKELSAQSSAIGTKLTALRGEWDRAKQRENEALKQQGFRDATMGDLLLGSAKRGYYNSKLGVESNKAMLGQENEKQKYEDILAGEDYRFLTDGWMQEAISGGAEVTGQGVMQALDPRTLALTATGTIGGGASGAILGAGLGSGITAPAGALAGAKAGFTTGTMAINYEVESGLAYNEMVANGVAPEKARLIATGVGGINSALEGLQVDELLDSVKILGKSSATMGAAERILDYLGHYAAGVGNNVLQETLQEADTILGAQVGQIWQTGSPAYSTTQVLERLGDTASSSLLTFAAAGLPGAARNIGSIAMSPALTGKAGVDAAQWNAAEDHPSDEQLSAMDRGAEEDGASILARAAQDMADGKPVSNRTASSILENPSAVQTLEQDAGLSITDDMTKSQRRAAVKSAVEVLASPQGDIAAPAGEFTQATGNVAQVAQNKEAAPARPVAQQAYDIGRVQQAASSMGEKGAKALAASYDGQVSADEYYAGFASYYEAGISGMDAEKVQSQYGGQLNRAQKYAAYVAGQNDAAVSLEKEKRAAQFAGVAGTESGLVYDDFVREAIESGRTIKNTSGEESAYLTNESYTRLNAVAKLLGTRVRFVDSVRDGTANAKIEGYEVAIEKNNENPVTFLLGHEWTHRMQELAPAEYRVFRDFVASQPGSGYKTQALLEGYHAQGEAINYEAALDEATANYAGQMLADGTVLDDFIAKHRQDRSLLEQVRDAIRALVRKLTGAERRQAQTAEGKLTKALEASAKQVERLTAEKNTATEGGDGKYSLNADFGRQFDAWMDTKSQEQRKTDGGYFRIGTTSEALKSIGVREGAIYWRKQKIGYLMSDHAEIDARTAKSVPHIIESPIVIMKSMTRDDSIVLFGDVTAANGQRVMAALELTPKSTGGMEAEFSLLTSAYSRSKESTRNLIEKSEILYLDPDKKRTDTWLMSLGVQFPSDQPMYGSMGSISYSGRNVKITGETFSSIVRKGTEPMEQQGGGLNLEKLGLGAGQKNTADAIDLLKVETRKGDHMAASRDSAFNDSISASGEKNNTDISKEQQDGGAKYSIKRTSKMTLAEQLKAFYDGKLLSSDALYFGETPSALDAAGLDPLPLVFTTADFKKSTKQKHNVPRRALNVLHYDLETALLAFSDGDRVGVLTADIDGDGKPLLIGIEANVTMDWNQVNAIRSVYGLDNVSSWLKNQTNSDKRFVILDEKRANAFLLPYGYLASRGDNTHSMVDSLTQNGEKSNTDMSKEQQTELSDKNVRYSIRKKPAPKETGIAYKVFYAKDGQLYPPMVANPNGAGTPVGMWLDADIGQSAPPSKTGRAQVQGGGKGTNAGKMSLAFRPGWHLGDMPLAKQFARLNQETGKKDLFPSDFVWAECEYAKDVDYQEEAMSYGYTENGKFRHAYAGLPKVPTDGYYRYRTNPNPDTVPWVISGAMKVNKILTDKETDAICRKNGAEPMARQGGTLNLEKLGLGATTDTKDGKTAAWSDKRIDRLYDAYASSSLNYAKAYAAFISPDDFLSLTTSNRGQIEAQSRPLDTKELEDERQEIQLTYDPETPGEVFGHEGRHRMVALKNAGVERVAIAIQFLGEAGKYDRKPIKSLPLRGEDFGRTRAPGNVTLEDLVPISQAYRTEIEEKFGKGTKADVRFSLKADSDGKSLTVGQREYFKDSKVVDKQGRLMVVYHGTKSTFTVFDRTKNESLHTILNGNVVDAGKKGFFFTDDKRAAETYGDAKGYYLSINNLLTTDSAEALSQAEKNGYDGVLFDNGIGYDQYVVFSPEQIKNRDNENPTDDPDIRRSLKGSENAGDIAALQEETSLLRDRVDYWRGQTRRSTRVTTDKKSVARAARELIRSYGADIETSDILDDLQGLYDYMGSGTDGENELTYQNARQPAELIARRLVDNALAVDDDGYQQYSDLRSYLHSTKLTISETDSHDIADYGEFRKHNFGRMLLGGGKTNIDQVYQEMSSMWPEFFDEQRETHPADQLVRISEVMDEIYDLTEYNPFSHYMDQAVTGATNEIMEKFFDLPQTKATFADRQARKLDEAKAKGKRQVQEVRAKKDARMEELRAQNRRRVQSAIQKERVRREKQVDKLKSHYKEKDAVGRERRSARELRAKIIRHTKALSKKLTQPSDKRHIPDTLHSAVKAMLAAINLESAFSVDPETGKWIRDGSGTPTKRTDAFLTLKATYQKMLQDNEALVIDPNLLGDNETVGNLDAVIAMKDQPIAGMDTEQLTTIWQTIRAVEASITNANKMLGASRFAGVAELAYAIRQSSSTKKAKGNWKGPIGFGDRLLNLDMMNPLTFLHLFGEGGDALYHELQMARDTKTNIVCETVDMCHKVVGKADIAALQDKTHVFQVAGGELRLTTAQLMSLYELSKRKQSQDHIYKGGIRATATDSGVSREKSTGENLAAALGKLDAPSDGVQVTQDDMATMLSALTEEEVKIADGLQAIMQGYLAQKGNQESMRVYGYRKFMEDHYFPITSDPHQVQTKIGDILEGGAGRPVSVAEWGSSKGTKEGANNGLLLGDIFDVFAQHSVDMAAYSSYLGVMEDMNRVGNFTFRNKEGGRTGTMGDIIQRVAGQGGNAYLNKLLQDASAGTAKSGTSGLSKLTANYKAASVGLNLRVALQQPTSYLRAAAVINPKYLLDPRVLKKDGWKKALKYAPIAQWKDWGNFEINQGRQIQNIMFGTDSMLDRARSFSMKFAGIMDSLTWGRIWNACELETIDTHPELARDSKDFVEAVAQRFTDIIDQTQVVDNVLGRSQMMRSGDELAKMATSYMGEPTQSYNLVYRSFRDWSQEQDNTKRTAAKKRLGAALVALTASQFMNAIAQAIWDAVRDDDDRDEKYWERMLGHILPNFADNANPIGMVPYLKDILSVLQGYEVKRMDMAAITSFISACRNMGKAMNGEGRYTLTGASANLIAEAARIFGLPASTVMRDLVAAARSVSVQTGDWYFQYKLEKALNSVGYSGNRGEFYDIAFGALKSEELELYQTIAQDLATRGVKSGTIENAMRERLKDALEEDPNFVLGQDAKDLIAARENSYVPDEPSHGGFTAESLNASEYREYSTNRADSYREMADTLEGYNTFRRLDNEAKSKALDAAYALADKSALADASGGRYEADSKWMRWATGGSAHGVDETEAILFKVAYDTTEGDKNGDGKTISGSKKENTLEAVDGLMPWLTSQELEYLMGNYWKK